MENESEIQSEWISSQKVLKNYQQRKKYSKTKTVTSLVTSSNLSTLKAANVCQHLFQEGTDIESLSQYGIYRCTITEAVELKEETKKKLCLENWSLCFDGKWIDGQE